jgi:sulfur-carrier protein adenylyltransferase/sulfurtransferase
MKGVRSRAAAATLSEAGFQQVYSMAGGIDAWNGLVAGGGYEAGLAYFSRASRAEELIALSFALEEGNRVFYERISQDLKEEEATSIFRSMSQAEERHKETLRELHARVTGKSGIPVYPEGMEAGGYLEGGSPLEETLEWAKGKTLVEILELAIAMEANALDRYIKMGRSVTDERSREVFLALSREEQKHLERMTSLLDQQREKG